MVQEATSPQNRATLLLLAVLSLINYAKCLHHVIRAIKMAMTSYVILTFPKVVRLDDDEE